MRCSRLLSSLALVALVTVSVPAQTPQFIVPANYAALEAGSRNNYPFGLQLNRTQMIYDGTKLGFKQGAVLEIAFRRDGMDTRSYGPQLLSDEDLGLHLAPHGQDCLGSVRPEPGAQPGQDFRRHPEPSPGAHAGCSAGAFRAEAPPADALDVSGREYLPRVRGGRSLWHADLDDRLFLQPGRRIGHQDLLWYALPLPGAQSPQGSLSQRHCFAAPDREERRDQPLLLPAGNAVPPLPRPEQGLLGSTALAFRSDPLWAARAVRCWWSRR